jgi:hypothetical protein
MEEDLKDLNKEELVVAYCLHNPVINTDRTIDVGRTLDNASKLAEGILNYLTQE